MSSEKSETALAMRDESAAGLAMVMTPTEAEERLKELRDFVKRVMIKDEDFGELPGTEAKAGERPRMVLFQPGAQKLAEVYGFAVRFEDERAPIERWDGDEPMFAYFKRASITRRRDGLFLGSGLGSCNSRETKYAGRWVFEREVPPHLDINRLKRRDGKSKKNGKPFTLFRVPNDQVFDLVNTIEKMACKRALVHAVIAVTRSSGLFTQDIEDMSGAERETPRAANGEVHEAQFEDEGDRHATPPPPSPADLLREASERARRDEASAEDLALLVSSSSPRARADGWACGIRSAPLDTLESIEANMREREAHARVLADMLALIARRRAEREAPVDATA